MNDDMRSNIFNLILSLPAFVAAFTVHEFAHAWMATRLGDDTAKRQGRLTLDPMAHLDPLGSLMFVLTQLFGYGIGWAKPVPFTFRNLGNPRRDTMLIAVAGPVSNLLQVPIWLGFLFVFRVVAEGAGWFGGGEFSPAIIILRLLSFGVIVNILLAAFNMFPFPPLDGHYILEGLGPPFIADFFNSIRPFSFIIIIVLANTGVIGRVIQPFVSLAHSLVSAALGAGFF